jgi:hypothetical protein
MQFTSVQSLFLRSIIILFAHLCISLTQSCHSCFLTKLLCESLISSLHSTCSVYFMHCNLIIPIICEKIKMFLELSHKSVVKMLCTWLNLVILKVLPAHIYTLALKVLLLLEEPLKVLYWYFCEPVVAFC